jgi:hypothetical protein
MDYEEYEDSTWVNYEDTLETDNTYKDGYDVQDYDEEE